MGTGKWSQWSRAQRNELDFGMCAVGESSEQQLRENNA